MRIMQNINQGYNAVLVDVDTTGCYVITWRITQRFIYRTQLIFLIFKDGKPEEVKDEDWAYR